MPLPIFSGILTAAVGRGSVFNRSEPPAVVFTISVGAETNSRYMLGALAFGFVDRENEGLPYGGRAERL